MGRLSEYINGSRGRSTYLNGAPAVSSGSSSDFVKVTGVEECQAMFDHLLTTDPDFNMNLRKLIRKALAEARKNLSKDAADVIDKDPRKAARAVKFSVYKKLFGGNLSILSKRKAGAKYQLIRERKLRPGQVGGNRRPYVDDNRNRLATYFGADRGFILRFLNAGTVERETRYGKRGSIRNSGWFEHTAPFEMEAAAAEVAEAINEYIKTQTNG